MESLKGEDGGRRTGLPKMTVGSGGGKAVVSSSAGGTSSLVSTGGFKLTEGLIGLLCKGLAGVLSIASSSSESTSRSRIADNCVTFLGLRGLDSLLSVSCLLAFVPSFASFLVVVDLTVRPAATGFRTGFARMPAVVVSAGFVAGVFALEPVSGRTFSLSGSANVTVFLTGLEAGAFADVVEPTGLPRVGFLTGSCARSSASSSWSTFALLARVRVDFAGSSFMGSVTGFFGGRPRVARVAVGADVGAGLESMIFLGRPGPRVARAAVPEATGGSLAGTSASLSSSWSSGRVLRLVDVLADGAATVEELEAGPAAARVAFVLVAAVAVFLAAEDAVPAVAVEAFPAALARVIRLGGDAGGSMVTGSWKLDLAR